MSARDAAPPPAPIRVFADAGPDARPPWDARERIAAPVCLPRRFTAAECDAILALARPHPARANSLTYPTEGKREALSRWLFPEPGWEWVLERLEAVFREANEHYGFSIGGFAEPLLVATYPVGVGFDWHVDAIGGMTATRKLSLSLQLTPRDEYDGGALEFASLGEMPLARGQGTVVCFPAFACHRVAPVTRGVREALVAWAHGPTFR